MTEICEKIPDPNFIQAEPSLVPPLGEYRCRLCFLVCLFSPAYWERIRESWKSDYYFIVEPNKEALTYFFHHIDLTPWLTSDKFHFFLGYDHEEVVAPIQRTLRQTVFAGKLMLSQVLVPGAEDKVDPQWSPYAHGFNALLRQTIDHIYFNFGNIDDSIEGFRATLENFDRMKQSGGITELENLHKDKAIAVIGAGPSLDHDLELLAKHQDKLIIIAVDAAIKPLLKAGIRIDYVSTIERFNGMQEKFFEEIPSLEADLICYPVVSKDVIKLYPGIVRFAYRNYAWYAYFEKNWPLGILESGGSASHLAARLAHHMGAAYILLIGCDMTYEKHPEKEEYRSHCKNTAYPDWDRYKTEAEIRGAAEFFGFHDVESQCGELVKTNTVYHQWAKEYSTMIMSYGLKDRVISTSKYGIKTPRLIYMPLSEIVTELHPIDVSRVSPMNSRAMSQIDHENMLKNLEGIYSLVTGAIASLDLLQQNLDVKNPQILKLCQQSLYEKLAHDTFFTAFIIQNSAMEFFRQESCYYAVPEGELDDEHYSLRISQLKKLYEILENVTRKTIATIQKATTESHVRTA